METAEKRLCIQNLSGVRENRILFSNLTFSVASGHCLLVRGPNGSGKSSLLKILVGLLPATAGKLYWCSRPILFPDHDYCQDILYLGHKNAVQTRLTVFENLKYWVNIRDRIEPMTLMRQGTQHKNIEENNKISNSINKPIEIEKVSLRIKRALEYWCLDELRNMSCDRLSAGQCQRLALARLLLVPVKLWVLDEPCNALDKKAVDLFEGLLEKHLGRGGSAVIVSHLPIRIGNLESISELDLK